MDTFLYILIGALVIWEAVWKGIALWRAVCNRHLAWFICIFIFNTVGILPIVYLYFVDKKMKQQIKTPIEIAPPTPTPPQ